MRRLLVAVALLPTMIVLAADPPAGTLQTGANLPGPLHPFNINGAYKGKFHDVVADYGLEPTIAIFVHGVEASDELKALLQQIDERIDKNPRARLRAFAVFQSDELPDIVTADDKREELVRKLEDLATSLMLKNVVLGLDSKKNLEKFAFADDAIANVLLYREYRVEAVHALPKSDAKSVVDKVLAEIGTKFKATKIK
jgi:hypothetical protein